MSCYFRHLGEVLSETGIKITKENKRAIDKAIHLFFAIDYKNCPVTWKAFKETVTNDPKKEMNS